MFPINGITAVKNQLVLHRGIALVIFELKLLEPGHEKICLMSYANNKSADQPAQLRSLISAFVVHCLESIISLDSIVESSRL